MGLERFTSYPSPPSAEETESERKARIAATPESDLGESFWFFCEGCDTHHSFRTKNARGEAGPIWSFNGDMKQPTFSPSLRVRYVRDRDGKVNPDGSYPNPMDCVCHLFVRNGEIEYLSDCTHRFKNMTVPLGDL